MLGDHVALDVDPFASLAAVQVRRLVSMRDDRDSHQSVRDRSDRQADPVNRDRSFINQESVEVVGYPNQQFPIPLPQFAQGFEGAGSIHMPLYDVPAEARLQSKRALEVHAVAGLKVAE